MAFQANTLATYQAIGNREDLSDMIYRIAPTVTPFVSGIARESANATKHEWQTQDLAAAASNAQLEGDDPSTNATTVTVRLSNVTQISYKVARVSGTQQAVRHAGRSNELAYQAMLKGLELKRDIEFNCLANQTQVAGDTTTARQTAAVLSWIKTNTDKASDGTTPSTSGSNSRGDGTQRAFLESQLKSVLQQCFTQGGNPDTIMAGPFNKQVFSTFTGRSSPIQDAKSKKITASVDVYESDFGSLKVVPNRFLRLDGSSRIGREVLVLEMEKWALAFLNGRNTIQIPLAKTGDSDRRQVLSEWTLVSRNEKASGGIFDLTTA
jgi:hypothetical protein